MARTLLANTEIQMPHLCIEIGGIKVSPAILDGGSPVNLISKNQAARVGLQTYTSTSVRIVRASCLPTALRVIGEITGVKVTVFGKFYIVPFIVVTEDSEFNIPVILGEQFLNL